MLMATETSDATKMQFQITSEEEFHAVVSDEPWSSQRTRLKTHFDQVTTTGHDTLEVGSS